MRRPSVMCYVREDVYTKYIPDLYAPPLPDPTPESCPANPPDFYWLKTGSNCISDVVAEAEPSFDRMILKKAVRCDGPTDDCCNQCP